MHGSGLHNAQSAGVRSPEFRVLVSECSPSMDPSSQVQFPLVEFTKVQFSPSTDPTLNIVSANIDPPTLQIPPVQISCSTADLPEYKSPSTGLPTSLLVQLLQHRFPLSPYSTDPKV